MNKYGIYNITKGHFVKEDDYTTIASFDTPEEATKALYRIEELSKLNPANEDDRFVIRHIEC